MFDNDTVVPTFFPFTIISETASSLPNTGFFFTERATGVVDISCPSALYSRRTPLGACAAVAVVTTRLHSAQSELRASPRKPNVETRSRSSKLLNFDV